MTAGNSVFHAEIFRAVNNIVSARITQEPSNWWTVKDVAELYASHRNIAKGNKAENSILTPLGLSRDTFIARQSAMKDEFIAFLTNRILNYNVPDIEAIVTGIDMDGGAHIFVVNNDNVSCWDNIGFASIGSGSRHAKSQFMFTGHSRNALLPESLLLTYTAKKRSEVSPGVGEETDMFMMGPHLGSYVILNQETMRKLNESYKKMILGEESAQNTAKNEVKRYVDRLAKRATKQSPVQKTTKIDGELNEAPLSDGTTVSGAS